jgi:hypothetical protein
MVGDTICCFSCVMARNCYVLDRNDMVQPAGRHRPVHQFEDTEKNRLISETNCKFKNVLV